MPRSESRPTSANSGHSTLRTERAFLVGIDYQPRRGSVAGQARRGAGTLEARECARKYVHESPGNDTNAGHAANGLVGPRGKSGKPKRTSFTAEESMAELRELASSAGAEIAGEFLQSRNKPDPATLIGRGKLALGLRNIRTAFEKITRKARGN